MAKGVTMKTTGLDDVVGMLEKLADRGECASIFTKTVKSGANVTADYMRKQIKSLKTGRNNRRQDKRYCTENEKKGLLDSMGWAPIKESAGTFDSNIGFDGYNQHTKTHQANAKIAHFINRGTSYMIAQPFIVRTRNAGRNEAEAKMIATLDEEINRRTR